MKLYQIYLSGRKRQKLSSYTEFEKIQQLCRVQSFQNGKFTIGSEFNETRVLYGVN